jgi:hypothetical protein
MGKLAGIAEAKATPKSIDRIGTSSKQTSYSKGGKTIRVDILHRLAIIAVGGKIGKPLIIAATAFGIRVA